MSKELSFEWIEDQYDMLNYISNQEKVERYMDFIKQAQEILFPLPPYDDVDAWEIYYENPQMLDDLYAEQGACTHLINAIAANPDEDPDITIMSAITEYDMIVMRHEKDGACPDEEAEHFFYVRVYAMEKVMDLINQIIGEL